MSGACPLAGISSDPLRREMTAETMRYPPAGSHTEVPSARPNLTNGVFRGTNPFPTGNAC